LGQRGYHEWQIVFMRCLLLAAFILPFALAGRSVTTARPLAHFIRTAIGLGGFVCFVFALTGAPLADVTVIAFTKVLFTVIFAIVWFREKVGWRRWVATALGFLGVVIMVRPGQGALNPALLFALGNALLVSAVVLYVKELSKLEKPETIVFYFGAFGALLTVAPAILHWRWPAGAEDWGLFALMAFLGVVGQSAAVRGWHEGEASAMAPLGYISLIYAGLFGYFLFSEIPGVWTYAGAAVIVAATLYLTIQEARSGRRAPAGKAAVPAPAE
jgi:drug/metabolite transporter (DMT)-like permease